MKCRNHTQTNNCSFYDVAAFFKIVKKSKSFCWRNSNLHIKRLQLQKKSKMLTLTSLRITKNKLLINITYLYVFQIKTLSSFTKKTANSFKLFQCQPHSLSFFRLRGAAFCQGTFFIKCSLSSCHV
jgi:hypothetical protein